MSSFVCLKRFTVVEIFEFVVNLNSVLVIRKEKVGFKVKSVVFIYYLFILKYDID